LREFPACEVTDTLLFSYLTMIQSFVLEGGRIVEENMDLDALRLVLADKGLHVWIDLENPTPEEAKLVLEDMFHFHPLAIEDCIQVGSLPKIEDYDDYLFLVMNAVNPKSKYALSTIELNMFIGKEFLITYHVERMRSISLAVERCRQQAAVFAKAPDRLTHAILDSMVDNYGQALDELSLQIQDIEDNVFSEDSKKLIGDVLRMKRELAILHQFIGPQRDIMFRLARGESKMIRQSLLPYFRDVYDHLAKIDEQIHAYKETLFLTLDIYLNNVANKTNDIIRVLTILTAVTTPIMIVGTWYGMNFKQMEDLELGLPWGYEYAWAITILGTLAIVLWFKHKKFI